MQKSEKYPHLLSQANAAQFNDSDEGGLNLGQVAAVLRRRILLILGMTGLLATAAVLKAETDPPAYLATFDILTRPVTGESKVVENLPQAISGENTQGELNETTIKVLQSHRVLDPIIEKLQPKYPDLTYDSLVSNLVIQRAVRNGQILRVQYTDEDPQKVIDVSNLLAEAYLRYSLQERQADIDQAIKFVIEQRKPLEERVEYWQNQLRNLRWQNSLIDPAQKATELANQITDFRQQQIANRVEIEQLVARYEDLQRELAQQPGERAGNSVLSENARYQKILDQIQTADIEIVQRSAVFTDDNPAMETLRQRKAYLLPLLAQEEMRVQRDFQSRIRALIARDRSFEDKIKNLNNSVRALATISRNHDNIQRELEIASTGLTQFTAKQQALQIEKSQKQQPWSLLDPRLTQVNEPTPVAESAKKNLAVGGVLGLLLGVGAALVVDKLSDIFYSAQELKETTRLPLLGIVPLRKELEAAGSNLSRGMQQPIRASFFEVFRSLYTNILLLSSDTPIRSLVISSAGQGDGKSTIAIQLAQAAAAMGQKVLLVDANLRCPNLHNRVGLMNIQGLTDVISQDLDWHNVIERSPLEENMFVMTAGPVPPDSIRLLASQKMQDLMDDLQASFDLVIYDTPPLLGFADAYLLANNTNGIVLVAGLGKLKRTALQQVLEEIKISGTPFLGMIANKSKDATPVSHNYYQQYYRRSASAEKVSVDIVESSSSSSPRRIGRS